MSLGFSQIPAATGLYRHCALLLHTHRGEPGATSVCSPGPTPRATPNQLTPGRSSPLIPHPPCLQLTSQLSTVSSATCDHARLADILLSVLAQRASTAASSRRWKAESHAASGTQMLARGERKWKTDSFLVVMNSAYSV